MKNIARCLTLVLTVMLFGVYAFPAIAAHATTQTMPDKVFQGTLAKVDADMHILTATGPDGKSVSFTYSDDTKVIGPAKDVQGLTGKPGAMLKISYRVAGESNIATRIEVQP